MRFFVWLVNGTTAVAVGALVSLVWLRYKRSGTSWFSKVPPPPPPSFRGRGGSECWTKMISHIFVRHDGCGSMIL